MGIQLVCGSATWRQYHCVNWLLAALFSALPFAAIADDDVATNVPELLVDTLAAEPLTAKFGSWELVPGFDMGVEQTDNLNLDSNPISGTFFAQGLRLKLKGNIEGTEITLRARDKLLLPSDNDSSYRNLTSRISLNIKHPVSDATTLSVTSSLGTYQDGVSPVSRRVENFYEVRPSVKMDLGKFSLNVEALAGKTWYPGYLDFDDSQALSPKQRNSYSLTTTVSRELKNSLNVYGGLTARTVQYDTDLDPNLVARGDTGYVLFTGLRGPLTEKFDMDVALAAVKQTFVDTGFDDKDYFGANGFLTYKPSDNFRLRLESYTGIAESLDFAGAGRFYRIVNLGGEYKLTDNWIAVAGAKYELSDYLYSDISERTTTWSAGLNYQVTPYGLLSVSLEKTMLRNDDPSYDYDENRFFAKLSIN